MKKLLVPVLVAGLSLGIANHSSAAVIVLDFEGIGDRNSVGNYYNGGGGVEKNYGITFSDNAQALVDADKGGSGNFGGEPSPDTVLWYRLGERYEISVQEGFDSEFSFWYSSINTPGSGTVYDKYSNPLASFTLPITSSDGGDPNGPFSPFYQIVVGFAGKAEHVKFTGGANDIGFDNITFGSDTPASAPTPEPASILLMMSGMTGFAFLKRKLQGFSSVG